jgi:hypothetical protein
MVAAPPCPPCPPPPPNPWTLLTFAALGTATAAGTGTVSDPGTDATLRLQRASGSGTTPWYWNIDSILGGASLATNQQLVALHFYLRWWMDVGQLSPFAGANTAFAVSLGARFANSGLATRCGYGWVGTAGAPEVHYLPACNTQQFTGAVTPQAVMVAADDARFYSTAVPPTPVPNRFGRGTARATLAWWRTTAAGSARVAGSSVGMSEPEGGAACSGAFFSSAVPSPAGVTFGAMTGATSGQVDVTTAVWYRLEVSTAPGGLQYPPTLVTP